MARLEGFEDVRELVEGHGGMFEGSEGLRELTRVTYQMDPDGQGFRYRINCEYCGSPLSLLVTWDELIMWAHQRPPVSRQTGKAWIYDAARGGVYPPVNCSRCRQPVALIFTADECGKRVQEGILARKLNPAYVQRLAAQLR